MLEAHAHNQFKRLLGLSPTAWPHNLTLCRLVARSVRRKDRSLIHLETSSENSWWLGLLIPLCLEPSNLVLVLAPRERRRLLQVELPRLKDQGFTLSCWQGSTPSPENHIWLMNHYEFIQAIRNRYIHPFHQIIFLEAGFLSQRFRDAMEIKIKPKDWEDLRAAYPSAGNHLLELYKSLSNRIASNTTSINSQVKMNCQEAIALRDLLSLLGDLPSPWSDFLEVDSDCWASWSQFETKTLNWSWHLKPLYPFHFLKKIINNNPILFISRNEQINLLINQSEGLNTLIDINIKLGGSIIQEPIPLFAPKSQPLPNTAAFESNLLDQCRRLILGRTGLTIIALDDSNLREKLAANLASEFGTRVIHQSTSADTNGVICCSWSWWLQHYDNLPPPEQLVVALLPLPSLKSPLVAARVEALKSKGRDWFRELLLPEALLVLSESVEPLRSNGGRLAILDGRLRLRSWGGQVFRSIEPWVALNRLLPG